MKDFMGVSEYSRHSGLSRKTIYKHLKNGLLTKTEDGLLDRKKCDEILAVLHGDVGVTEAVTGEAIDYLQQKRVAEARYRLAKARMAELELEERKGQLIRTEQVVEDLKFVCNAIKQRLLAWQRGLPPKLAHKDERGCMKVLQDEIWFILNELGKGVKSICRGVKK